MKGYNWILFLLASCLWACTTNDLPEGATLSTSEKYLTLNGISSYNNFYDFRFACDGQLLYYPAITVDASSGTNWRIESDADWLSFSPSSGTGAKTLSVVASENSTYSYRECSITLMSTDINFRRIYNVYQEKSLNGHAYVDLGLPSGLRWATCNVGAIKPEDDGEYFAWGETSAKTDYSSSTSSTYDMTVALLKSKGIIGSDGNLSSACDVARQEWGGTWRMPTADEVKELIDNTTMTWTTRNGQYGCRLKSNTNGRSIFLPAAGYRNGESLDGDGSRGYYWSSSPVTTTYDDYYADCLEIHSAYVHMKNGDRSYGCSVRPVSNP